MIIGHVPAGYVLSRLLLPRFKSAGCSTKAFLWSGGIGAFAPDSDMLYFHLIDHGHHHHHSYVSHYPIVWLALLCVALTWLCLVKTKAKAALATIFLLNGFFHLILDSIVGDIWWLAPWSNRPFSLFSISGTYQPWWLNFLLHPSFALEIAILIYAFSLWRHRPLGPQVSEQNAPERLMTSEVADKEPTV